MRSPDLAANAAITSRPSGLCFLFYGEVTHGSRNAWNFACRAIVQRIGARAARIDAMPNRDPNDTRLVTPLLLMGLIVVCGLLYYAYIGHA